MQKKEKYTIFIFHKMMLKLFLLQFIMPIKVL